jgi:hypothetical protein
MCVVRVCVVHVNESLPRGCVSAAVKQIYWCTTRIKIEAHTEPVLVSLI